VHFPSQKKAAIAQATNVTNVYEIPQGIIGGRVFHP